MKPSMSVIVPTLGRETLLRTIESLAEAEHMGEIEVIVVGEIDDDALLRKVTAAASDFLSFAYVPIRFPTGDLSRKRNEGVNRSQADIVAFVDDDVILGKRWIERMLSHFSEPNIAMVSGPSLVPDELSLMGRLAGSALASGAAGYVASRYRMGAAGPRVVKWSRVIGCNMAFRKELLVELGGFDPKMIPGEELLVSFQLAQKGYEIIFDPDAFLWHYPRQTFRSFCRQIYRFGATRIRLLRAGVDFEVMTVIPAVWVMSLLVLGVGSFFSLVLRLLFFLNIVLYLLVDFYFTIQKVWETRRLADIFLFLMIPVMHLSYGIAEWDEILRPQRDLPEKQL